METLTFRPLAEEEIIVWYHEELTTAFAPQECKPLPDIRKLLREGRYELWGLFDGGSALLGYAALWKSPAASLILLDYLGITAQRRNEGLGALILEKLKEQGRPMVVESELPVAGDDPGENHIRHRRIAFYRRCGFTPVYKMATCGMAWQTLLFNPHDLPLSEVQRQHRLLYGPARTDVQVPLTGLPRMPYWMTP
ncbi:MAG: GNAT family N-acetyltransferase [Clostridiales bacterium]|nr:GNAT family N-acetyltransferase [Clostridiales bacterium]